ncbi:MAG: hypothetical protein ACON4Q_05540 [Candidatus Puniceispirillaceae bacterium]
MKKVPIIAVVVLVILGGAGIMLANWEIPAPTKEVSKVISNERFE